MLSLSWLGQHVRSLKNATVLLWWLGIDAADLFLTHDLSVRCWTSQHLQTYILALGMPLFLVCMRPHRVMATAGVSVSLVVMADVQAYVLGIPCCMYYVLSNQDTLPQVYAIIDHFKQARTDAELVAHEEEKGLNQHHQEVESPRAELSVEAKQVMSNFSFLFLGFQKHAYWWELVSMLRKAVIALIGVVFATAQRTQGRLD